MYGNLYNLFLSCVYIPDKMFLLSTVLTFNNFQDLKSLFKETKQVVNQAQLGWETELQCLGEIQASCSFLFSFDFCLCQLCM